MPENLNILQIGSLDCRGGAAQVSWNLHQGYLERGLNSYMFVGYKYSGDPRVQAFYPNWRGRFNYYRSFLLANDISGFNTDKLFKSEVYKKADIVHFHNLHASFFNLKALERISQEKKVLWTFHDMWAFTGHCAYSFDCERWQIGCGSCPDLWRYQGVLWDNTKKIWQAKKAIYDRCNLNIAVPSFWLKKKVAKSILSQKPIYLVYNGIDNKIFRPYEKIEARRSLRLPPAKKIILFLAEGGIYDTRKGGSYFKDVVAHYKNDKNILFLCIGGQENKIDEEFKNLLYLARVENKDKLANYYSAADIFLCPSLAETFGLVAVESLSCGTPVIAFGPTAVSEVVVHKKNGYIAGYKNTSDLINGIEYIFGLNKDELEKISQDSIQRVKENFSLPKIVDNYLNLYQLLLQS